MADFNYNVHGLIKIKSNIDLSLVDRRLRYFSVEKTKPDITVNVEKDFEVNVDEAIRIIPHICGTPNGKWIYYDKTLAFFKLKMLIKNLLEETKITATSSYLKMHLKIGGITPLWETIPFIMDIKLLNKGYTFMHGACLSKKGNGILICAFPNTGKTLTTLQSLKKEYGFSYLSDDITIVDNKGYAYCYPDPHPIFDRIKRKPLNQKDYVKSMLKLISPVIKFHVNEPITQYTDLYKTIENPSVIQKTKLETVIFLERNQESTEEINSQNAYNKLTISKTHEFPLWTDPIMLGYSYFNPEVNLEKLLTKQQQIISNLTASANKFFILRSTNPKKFIDMLDSIV